MAAKKQSTGKATKAKAGARAKKPAAKKAASKAASKQGKAKKATTKKSTRGNPVTGLDKSVEQFRDSLERSVTLSRDRLQEVVDDAQAGHPGGPARAQETALDGARHR
jgi:hypothetical protein